MSSEVPQHCTGQFSTLSWTASYLFAQSGAFLRRAEWGWCAQCVSSSKEATLVPVSHPHFGAAVGSPGVKFGALSSGEAPHHGHQHPSAPPTLGCPTQGEGAGLASPRRKPLSTLTTHLQPPGQKRVPKNHPGAASCRARRDQGASNLRLLLLASSESSRVLPGAGSRRLCVGCVALISHLLLAG